MRSEEKKLPPEIKAILEKEEWTSEDIKIIDDFCVENEDWKKRIAAETKIRKQQEENYLKYHKRPADPEWW